MRLRLHHTIIFILLFKACAPNSEPTANIIYHQIETYSSGLRFVSEIDSAVYPLRIDRFPVPLRTPLSKQNFAEIIGSQPGTQIDDRVYAEFFRAQVSRDVNWLSLQNYLTTVLTDVKVYRVGGTNCQYYVVGTFDGKLFGIQVLAVET